MKFSRGDIDRVIESVDLIELIRSYLPDLRKSGLSFSARCPWHKERTASLSVNPVKRLYLCRGCGMAGNAISFLMAMERITFPAAVRSLATRSGVTLEGESEAGRRRIAYENLIRMEAIWFWRHAVELGFGLEWQRPHTIEAYLAIRAEYPWVVLEFRKERDLDAEIARVFARATALAADEWNYGLLMDVLCDSVSHLEQAQCEKEREQARD